MNIERRYKISIKDDCFQLGLREIRGSKIVPMSIKLDKITRISSFWVSGLHSQAWWKRAWLCYQRDRLLLLHWNWDLSHKMSSLLLDSDPLTWNGKYRQGFFLISFGVVEEEVLSITSIIVSEERKQIQVYWL